MTERLNSRELAQRYELRRDQMEDLLAKIKAHSVGTDEPRYDPEEVARLLATEDAQNEQGIVSCLDRIRDDELAAEILIQGVKDAMKRFGFEYSETIEQDIARAKDRIVGQLFSDIPSAIRAKWHERQSCSNPQERADCEWEFTREAQIFRDRLLQALHQRRVAQRAAIQKSVTDTPGEKGEHHD